ncbi:thioredoxin family protein [Roseobacter sp. HKCCA0434]|uniref:thioredoxin family protein n=1 Tax=Roseobacter sp. HKCCA0434 TaxID=3079297 RepID=UPI002905F182|nr:thioredoxin family protein [Roseobacter sp. HKCCA0434]
MFRTAILTLGLTFAPLAALAELGDDGLHRADWIQETFLDLREDHAEAAAQDRTLMVMIEQRGCIYCTRMHEQVFPDPDVQARLDEDYYVVRINMFGDLEVTDFDGEVMAEKDIVRRWNAQFTPTLMLFPDEVAEDVTAPQAAVVTMPGAFGKWTTVNLLDWVHDDHWEGDEGFQRYHARRLQEEGIVE